MILNILHNIERNKVAFFDFYLFLIIAIIFIIVKLNKSSYFNDLYILIFAKISSSEESFNGDFGLKFSTISLKLCFILMISYAIHLFSSENKDFFTYISITTLVFIFYSVQSLGFYAFEKMIDLPEQKTNFYNYKTAYTIAFTTVLFPYLFLINYMPVNLNWLIVYVLISIQLIGIIRTSIYLGNFISKFHIILYLCTSEIILVLFFIKYLFKII